MQMNMHVVKGERSMAFTKTSKALSMPAGILLGAAISVLITLILSIITANFMTKEIIKDEQIGYIVMGILAVAAFYGCTVSAQTIKRQRLLVCALGGLSYFAFLLSMTALFFGGQYSGVGASMIVIAAGTAASVILGIPRRKSVIRMRKKRGYR